MAGFSADWLALREPADRAARSAHLIAAAGAWLSSVSDPCVCDLGAGTGASVRAFGPHFPRATRWTLVDADPATLAEARGPNVTTRVADLVATPAPWPDGTSLVTATALFDLAAPQWIDALAAALARDRLPILSCLTFDGRILLEPGHPFDDAMVAAFNAHQRTDKGLGGPAAGPDAQACLADALRRHGYRVREDDTPWRLSGPDDEALIGEVLKGWAEAAADLPDADQPRITDWLEARLAVTQTLLIGHSDLFATPPD